MNTSTRGTRPAYGDGHLVEIDAVADEQGLATLSL
jgi:hypothetical protein